ncbi:MAG TPA: tetratricopeptide repeat protein, partial [Methylophilaceae bacterium]|nr:tetratricopeptide repeat protein [Methylophilaceae bacterium]
MRLTQFYKKMQRWVLFTTFLLPLYAVAMEDVVAQQARALMQSGDYVGAYKLLEPLEEVHAGESDFDYLLGVAGVESGNVTRGVFALERVLATEPNHTDARTEMAKAHFKLGEVESSKLEFQNVLDQKPSQEVTSAIARYVTAIDKSLGLTTTFGGF